MVPNGSVNEMKFANGVADDLAENLAKLDVLGTPATYNHYTNGWAMAFNTPFKMWKRYEFNGGTCDPCIISWPAGVKARGELREQYHHAIDIAPTLLDLLGVEAARGDQGPHPGSVRRGQHARQPRGRNRRRRRARRSSTPMLGSRSIWHEGWKAVTTHPTMAGWGHFNDDEWELYNTDVDRAELHNLAAEQPDKVRELVNIWFSEAGANVAFPLDDRSPVEILSTPRPQLTAARSRYIYRPGAAVPEWQAVNTRNRSFAIGAVVDDPTAGAQGVLFSMGSRFGGHALYVKDNRLHYVNSFVGSIEQHVVGSEDIPTGDDVILSAAFDKDGNDADGATGTLSLYPRRPEGRRGSHQDPTRRVRDRGRRTCTSDATRRGDHRGLSRATRRTRSRVARSTGSRST